MSAAIELTTRVEVQREDVKPPSAVAEWYRGKSLAEYIEMTGQESDPLAYLDYEQIQRELRRGNHGTTCSGYNERQCDCGLVDRVETQLASALLEIASLTETLALRDAKIAELQQLYQRTLHRAERAESGLRAEVIESAQTWGLEIRCDGNCGVTPLRIRVAPPEDAVPGYVRGMGWTVDGDNHWCPGCAP